MLVVHGLRRRRRGQHSRTVRDEVEPIATSTVRNQSLPPEPRISTGSAVRSRNAYSRTRRPRAGHPPVDPVGFAAASLADDGLGLMFSSGFSTITPSLSRMWTAFFR